MDLDLDPAEQLFGMQLEQALGNVHRFADKLTVENTNLKHEISNLNYELGEMKVNES